MTAWEKILNNAHKVPGIPIAYLDADVYGYANWISDKSYEVTEPLHLRSFFEQRMALLRITDAMEQAGLALFERELQVSCQPRKYWWTSLLIDGDNKKFMQARTGSSEYEHLALLECVAQTLEAMPAEAAT